MFGLIQTNSEVNKQYWCQHCSTAIWCRRLSEMLFSILLNWPLGLIILLAGFRCHTMWDLGGVCVCVCVSVWLCVCGDGGVDRVGKGKDWGGSRERAHPGVKSPCLFCFDLRVRATADRRLFLTWIYPAVFWFLFSFLARVAFSIALSELGAARNNHRRPLMANEQLDCKNKRLSLTRTQTKPICVFVHGG